MTELPRFGQYAASPVTCPVHPGQAAVAYCRSCNRPTCAACAVQTRDGTLCVECSKKRAHSRPWAGVRVGPLRHQPVVTYGLIGSAVVIYLLGLAWPTMNTWLAFNPLAAYVQPWRFLTVALVHGSFLHLLFNMMMLYFIGVVGEATAGHWRFLGLYVLSTLGGSVGILAWGLVDQHSLLTVTVGASGALYGLLGAVFITQWRSGQDTRSILVLLVVNLAYSFMMSGISWQGHIGGLITGALVAWMYLALMRPRPGATPRGRAVQEILATVGVFALLSGLAFGIYQLLSGTVIR